jgi:phage host-nuclease inhibitor protein Gam
LTAASVDWRDAAYDKIFEQELRGLRKRRESDPSCTVRDIEGVLRHLYNMDGSDWVGRGGVQDVTMAATIAAHERFIAEWKAELRNGA